jgi:hypothetical protein
MFLRDEYGAIFCDLVNRPTAHSKPSDHSATHRDQRNDDIIIIISSSISSSIIISSSSINLRPQIRRRCRNAAGRSAKKRTGFGFDSNSFGCSFQKMGKKQCYLRPSAVQSSVFYSGYRF